jgi:hypothetical protein
MSPNFIGSAIRAFPPVRRRYGRSRLQVLVAGVIVSGVILFGYLGYVVSISLIQKGRETKTSQACIQHEVILVRAMLRYVRDYDNTFPAASTWCDSLRPYVADEGVFVCPSAPALRCGYAFNSAYSGIRYEPGRDNDKFVVIFESDGGWNASGGRELLPRKPRHHGVVFFGFLAGYVAGFPSSALSELEWRPPATESSHPAAGSKDART